MFNSTLVGKRAGNVQQTTRRCIVVLKSGGGHFRLNFTQRGRSCAKNPVELARETTRVRHSREAPPEDSRERLLKQQVTGINTPGDNPTTRVAVVTTTTAVRGVGGGTTSTRPTDNDPKRRYSQQRAQIPKNHLQCATPVRNSCSWEWICEYHRQTGSYYQ
ncbi:hypothetical protein Tco_0215530 [Tanacetum coccineum]